LSRVSLKISKDKAARKAKQNQEWGTTRNQNPESNSNNKQISKRGINREAPKENGSGQRKCCKFMLKGIVVLVGRQNAFF
jgi:hypothetical protein